MGRHTSLVKHEIPDTSGLLLEEGKLIGRKLNELLKPYGSIAKIHIERGQNITVECWEDIWTSGM